MINIAFVDDEENFLSRYILECVSEIGTDIVNSFSFKSKETLLNNIKNDINLFQVIYLNVDLMDLDDIDISNKIISASRNSKSFYITKIVHVIRGSFKKTPDEYILKPISKNIIMESILKTLKELTCKKPFFEFSQNKTEYIIKSQDIISLSLQNGRIINLKTISDDEYNFYSTVKDVISKLNCLQFVQINPGTIINISHIKKIEGDEIMLINLEKFYISKKYQKILMMVIDLYNN